ncbi:hypothetical protein D9M72_459470 [compost metagenome]
MRNKNHLVAVRLDLDRVFARDELDALLVRERADALGCAGQPALGGADGGVPLAREGCVLSGVQMNAAGRAGLDARGAGEHEVWFVQFRKAAILVLSFLALNRVVLRLQGLLHDVLIGALLLRLVHLSCFGQCVVLVLRCF